MSEKTKKAKLEVLQSEAETLRYLSKKSSDDEVRSEAFARLRVLKEEIEKVEAEEVAA